VNQDDMFRVTRRYTFSASHRLHAIELSDAANRALYGKCNNAYGHGHNYTVEVSVRGPLDPVTGRAVDTAALDRLVRRHVVEPFDHHNLNSEVPVFAATVPTSENLGLEICRRLKRNWEATFPNRWPVLEKIRIGETPRNIFEVGAHEIE
jgi:6-pyruvoyltetrahydropterin/6-carboxytetrahydropterin synthase